ncbi:PTS sugar transporter subunit IIA [Exiguobacterium algae]|uniref:PTS sugar transporter subunit IIA n=1 Tax=Exiguobacterium algae TaxID=2751250 RepID=UPI001BEB6EAB|nr:PTS glucose transporter subunit IIA [Exiguobacterium algae]
MLWNKLLKQPSLTLHSPMEGDVIPLEDVPDPVFNEKMMGNGIAILPTNGRVVAPCNGTVIQIAPSKHAIGIRSEAGAEILIHIGLDTVELEGRPFTLHVKAGDEVSTGQALMTADLESIHQAGKDSVTPMVVTNEKTLSHHYTFHTSKAAIPGDTLIARAEE